MINRVVLVGRLTRDVEVRKTQSGLSVAQFTVACDRRGSAVRTAMASRQLILSAALPGVRQPISSASMPEKEQWSVLTADSDQ